MLVSARDIRNQLHLEPFLYEKHVNHQNGIAGHLSIRLLEARDLIPCTSTFWLRSCNPYVIFRVGTESMRSCTIQGNENPTWRREFILIPIPKLKKKSQSEEISNVQVELIIDVMNDDSLAGRATECMGMTNGSLIGTASVDITKLMEGQEEIMDRWYALGGAIPLEMTHKDGKNPTHARSYSTGSMYKQLVLGEVRLILQYEPHGMDVMLGDIVRFEGFGLYPSAILPPMHELELEVKKMSGNFLYCKYMTRSKYEGYLKIHRNNVFVAHRTSIFDRVYANCIASPVEYLGNTPLGKSCREAARPYVKIALAFSWPALMATKTAVTTTIRASSAAAGAILAAYSE